MSGRTGVNIFGRRPKSYTESCTEVDALFSTAVDDSVHDGDHLSDIASNRPLQLDTPDLKVSTRPCTKLFEQMQIEGINPLYNGISYRTLAADLGAGLSRNKIICRTDERVRVLKFPERTF